MVRLSREASSKSDCHIGMSAVLVKKNRIVRVGYNRKYKGASIHAEEDVFRKTKLKQIDGATLYITRYGNKDNSGVSRLAAPCARCSRLLRKALSEWGLKAVYYTVTPEEPSESIVSWERWDISMRGYTCRLFSCHRSH